MSQASRSHALARMRWRVQVAHWMWREGVPLYNGTVEHPSPTPGHYMDCPSGSTFDVAVARARAVSALRQAEADLVELEVFKDWTRDRGRGPETEWPAVFESAYALTPGQRDDMVADGWHAGTWTWVGPVKIYRMARCAHPGGGWPGSLVREYARKRCPNRCEVRTTPDVCEARRWYGVTGEMFERPCTACDQRGWVPHGDRRAEIVTAPARARVARRVLDMLDARPGTVWEHAKRQPSECPECTRWGPVVRVPPWYEEADEPSTACLTCRSTGHNLRGVLPPVDWPAVVMRKAEDGAETYHPDAHPVDWTHDIQAFDMPRRVVPRGTHRKVNPGTHLPRRLVTIPPERRPSLDARITARGELHSPAKHMPRWRRGEWRHMVPMSDRDAWMTIHGAQGSEEDIAAAFDEIVANEMRRVLSAT